jgi:hypothetical protein
MFIQLHFDRGAISRFQWKNNRRHGLNKLATHLVWGYHTNGVAPPATGTRGLESWGFVEKGVLKTYSPDVHNLYR